MIKSIKAFGIFFFILTSISFAQSLSDGHSDVYVDSSGIMRWKGSNEEVSLFGINYTTPFAYAYRAQKKLGLSLKKAIDLDVAQMVRLGLDAFRVHVWDREITDKEGNILKNEHLDLLDYLLSRLEANRIKIILTPIAWWGTGWPEPDIKTNGFSNYYSKLELITNPNARKAERNYLSQFINHVNPYTKTAYKNDHSIIALEIINEPSHPNNEEEVTNYINEMVKTLRDAGFSKSLFYNISQNWTSTTNAQAVCNANIQGVSFQWYPTGLVHNKMLTGNYLINVNQYSIPTDSLTGYNNKAKMVYEFETADVLGAYMYPAIARSFREAGMQFATMFGYDPTQIAWSNTEYPTHYLNLLYTPSKALSLMIASKAFHLLPRMKSYGDYPSNNKFGDFLVSYKRNLSEMNSDTEFIYTNSTNDIPKDASEVKHIAGCGNSALVKYDGSGAYFLDKLNNGIWKLEVYPDVLLIRDPFEPTSMSRQVARLYWNERKMKLSIPSLGENFMINCLSDKKFPAEAAANSGFKIKPGIYLLSANEISKNSIAKYLIKKENFLDGLYIPPPDSPSIEIVNKTQAYFPKHSPVKFKFKIASEKRISNAEIYVKRLGWRGFAKYSLEHTSGFNYIFRDSSKYISDGELEYCVAISTGNKTYTFPGAIPDLPDRWDFYSDRFWKTRIVSSGEAIVLLNAARDRKDFVFPQFSRTMQYSIDYKNGSNINRNAINTKVTFLKGNEVPFAIQLSMAGIVKSLGKDLNNYKYVILKARTLHDSSLTIGINMVQLDGVSFNANFTLNKSWRDIKIPVSDFVQGSFLILPSSYPLFLPKIWNPKIISTNEHPDFSKLNFIQVVYGESGIKYTDGKSRADFEIESVTLSN